MAGTPGACSQVFCHSIRCTRVMVHRQRSSIYSPFAPPPPPLPPLLPTHTHTHANLPLPPSSPTHTPPPTPHPNQPTTTTTTVPPLHMVADAPIFAGRADFPVVAQRLVPFSGLFVGPSRFPSCSEQGGRCPWFAGRASSACLMKPVAIPQVQFLDKVICPWLNDRFHGLDNAEN